MWHDSLIHSTELLLVSTVSRTCKVPPPPTHIDAHQFTSHVQWLIYEIIDTGGMTRGFLWLAHVTWRVDTCDMSQWYVWHDSLIRVTCLGDMCDMTYRYMCHDSCIPMSFLLTYVTHKCALNISWQPIHTRTHTHTHSLSLSLSLSLSHSCTHTHTHTHTRTHAHIHTHIYTYMNIGWRNHEITSTQASEQLANLRPYAYIHVYMYRLTKPRDYDDTNKVDGPRTLNQAPSFEGSGFRMYVCMWMCHVTCMNAHVWHDPIQRQ